MNQTQVAVRVQVSREGKISLPASQRRAAGIAPGSEVIVEQVGHELRIRSIEALLADLAVQAERLAAGRNDSVDRFIADRRADAAHDEYPG